MDTNLTLNEAHAQEKIILIDWLTFTVGLACLLDVEEPEGEPDLYGNTSILHRVQELLGISEDAEFLYKDRAYYGYKESYSLGGLRICFGGCDTVMVDLSGEGCRLLESLNTQFDWLELILKIGSYPRHNFSRMDVACDTFGLLKMQSLIRYTMEERYISRWRLPPRVVQKREETIDFGSGKSNTMLRIYNKTLERQCKLDPRVDVPQNWIRCELQLRDEAVDSFIREWTARLDISAVYFGLMANQLRFVKKREDNLERSVTVAWWRRFLDNSNPIRLAYKGGLAYNLQVLEKYVYGQAASSIHTLLVASDWDVETMLNTLVHRQLNQKQQALLFTLAALEPSKAERTNKK